MVANTPNNLVGRFVPPPEPLLSGRWRLFRFTRSDAQELVRLGRIPEDASTELLNGMIVLTDRSARDQDPMMVGPAHRKCVERLSSLRKSIDNDRRHVESQQPLVCSETHVPQPDFMILRGTLDQYQDLPAAADAFCVVEVADSSYERDAGEKLEGYARAGIRQYVIINLRARTAEVYALPNGSAGTYPSPTVVAEGGTLSLQCGEGEFLDFPLAAILP